MFIMLMTMPRFIVDNPPYCPHHRYEATVSEGAAPGTAVLRVEAIDDDEPQNARLRYVLIGDGADLFQMGRDDGRVTVAAALDRETSPTLRLLATVSDRDRPDWSCRSELAIALADINDNAPRFSAPAYTATLPEDAEPGTLVTKLHAADPDLGAAGRVRYSLPDTEDAFLLDPDSGIVTLRAPLDRETRASYSLRVLAADAGEPVRTATALLSITVADVNDNPPEFQFRQYSARVPELDAVGTELLRVTATSRDAGVNAEIYYSIIGGNERDAFSIDSRTGVISVARPLDYERTRQYLLTVQAVDGGSPPLSDVATVNITIVDGNDNPPVFAQEAYAARVREDATTGTLVAKLEADDADSGANGRVTYGIVRGDDDGRFAVDERTGAVTLAAALDRETRASYALVVRARDAGAPAMEAVTTLRVDVEDVNDNPPSFSSAEYSAVLQEDRPPGHAVLELLVTDADAPPNAGPFTFDFRSGNEMNAFRLDQDGVLRTAAGLNRRVRERHELTVRVFDNGIPPLYSDARVVVRVIEESRYPPVVTPLDVLVNSYLDEFPGGVVGRLHAADRDPYDRLVYALAPVGDAPYPATDLFAIDAGDGTVTASPRLDVGEYVLNATVSDGKYVGHALIRVTVALITDEMLAEAVIVRFREVTARDFVQSHRRGFVRAVSAAVGCRAEEVSVLSVQVSGESESRTRRQVARDLDVLFAAGDGAGGFLPAEELRRALHEKLEALEESARLVVEELVRGACVGCERGACRERVRLLPGVLVADAELVALAAPPHRLEAVCDLAPAAPLAPRQPPVLFLEGDGRLVYRMEPGGEQGSRVPEDELSISLRLRTLRPYGTLVSAVGRFDYAVLEVADGFVQFRMELGSGKARARVGVPVSDGAWHEVRLERRGSTARLTVDRHAAHAQSPAPARVLDARSATLTVGGGERPFAGCLSELRLAGAALPVSERGEGAGVTLLRAEGVRVLTECPPLPAPDVCASYPCLNG